MNVVADLAELHLHAFAVGELDAETFAAADIVLRDFDAALGPAEPAHAMRQPRRTKPDLDDLEAVAEAAEHVVVGDFEAVEFELAMAAVLLRAHDLDAAHDAPARLILVKEKGGEPPRLSSEVRAARMKCAAPSAPVMNHLRP